MPQPTAIALLPARRRRFRHRMPPTHERPPSTVAQHMPTSDLSSANVVALTLKSPRAAPRSTTAASDSPFRQQSAAGTASPMRAAAPALRSPHPLGHPTLAAAIRNTARRAPYLPQMTRT